MKKFTVFLCSVFLVFGLAENAGAVTLTWTDNGTYTPSYYEGENPIVYSLTFEETGDPVFEDAVFTIRTEPVVDSVGPRSSIGWYWGGEINHGQRTTTCQDLTAIPAEQRAILLFPSALLSYP